MGLAGTQKLCIGFSTRRVSEGNSFYYFRSLTSHPAVEYCAVVSVALIRSLLFGFEVSSGRERGSRSRWGLESRQLFELYHKNARRPNHSLLGPIRLRKNAHYLCIPLIQNHPLHYRDFEQLLSCSKPTNQRPLNLPPLHYLLHTYFN